MNDSVVDYWALHYVDESVALCSLCGNTGEIDTTETAVSAAGVRSGRKQFCICPNGQVLRARADAERERP